MDLRLEGYSGQQQKRFERPPGISFYENAMKTGEILEGQVVIVEHSENLNTDVLILDLYGIKGIIPRSEVDAEREWKSLVGFVGRKVWFKVKGVDRQNQIVACSRKDAQLEMREKTLAELKEGLEVKGLIRGFTSYGAFVELGGVTGFMRNIDFSEDGTPANEVLELDDLITVKVLKINADKSRIYVEMVPKYKAPSIRDWDQFRPNQVVSGVVRNIEPWGVYVNIAPGLDALGPIPPTGDLNIGAKVAFRITQVNPEKKRVRGKVVRIL